jgi:copper resistance protein D
VIDVLYASARAVHLASCLLLLAVCVIDRFIATEAAGARKILRRRLLPLAWLIALASGGAWFYVVTANMSGQTPTIELLGIVWSQTHFGLVWKIRLILWVGVGITAILPVMAGWLTLIANIFCVGSLAWSAHGQTSGDGLHLAADAVHLLVAGCWPTGLFPFLLILRQLRADPAPAARMTNRFSAMSLCCVIILAASGLVNSWYLVGSISNLLTTQYGRVLTIKLALFASMIALGAVNLLRLKPRLAKDASDASASASAALRRNVLIETLLAALVFIITGLLGTLPPAAGCG